MKRLLVLLVFSFSLFAQSTTPILIPVFYYGGGQVGSQWYTQVFLNNFTSQPIDGGGITFIVPCPIPEGCYTSTIVEGGSGNVAGPLSARGLLLHVPAEEADKVEIQASFGEASRHSYGVQLPIARERDFHTNAFALPLVFMTGDFRTTLRLYGLEAGDVRVELLPWYAPENAFATRTITLSTPEGPYPAFAQLDLQREFPSIQDGAVRVRITPLGPRVWAFATVTQNATNEVTVITSQ